MRKSSRPPKLFEFFLQMTIPFEDREALVGDFEEMYHRILNESGKVRALCWYLFHIIKLVPSFFKNTIYWRLTMLKNYFKIALRNIKSQKICSFINIAGLAIGMACTILLMLWVLDELSYDTFYENSDRIYRAARVIYEDDGKTIHSGTAGSAPAFGNFLKNDYPQDIDELVRVLGSRSFRTIEVKGEKFKEKRLFYAEENFFKIFPSPFLAGNPETALSEPGYVVITESISVKYFGNDDPVGKVLRLDKEGDLLVTGVIRDVPHNSHFKFDLIVSMSTLSQQSKMLASMSDWRHHWFKTYVLFNQNVSIEKIKADIRDFIDRHHEPVDNVENASDRIGLHLQPLESIHLYSHYMAELEENGKIEYVYIFSAIAILILALACINFMNLSTAHSIRRSKEIGIRKACGAEKFQIIRQFITESAVVSFFAFLVAIVLVKVALPFFNEFSVKDLTLDFSKDISTYSVLLFICIITGLFAGSYPAFFISAFDPISALKNIGKKSKKGILIRRLLVIAQFTISIALITCFGIISSQMSYLTNIDLGYNRNNLINVTIEGITEQNFELFKSKLLQNQNIKNVGSSDLIPTHPLWNISEARTLDGDNPGIVPFGIRNVCVDYDFFDTYQIKMVAGRNFSRKFTTDSSAFILNETTVRELGWGEAQNAVNRRLEFDGEQGRIIGVVKDIHFESLHNEIRPTLYELRSTNMRQLAIKIVSEDFQETMRYLKEVWSEHQPHGIFEYSFLDDIYNNLYKSENNLGYVVEIFAFLSIIIACLGLLGLASFTVEQRTKEIGIRKVLGATVHGIINLLLKEFAVLVCLANIIAWPVAYYLMNRWLQEFAYSISVKVWIFIASGITALFIALATVSWQAGRAARTNPVNSLKYE